MKKSISTFLLIILLSARLLADWGFFEDDRSYIGITFNGSNSTYTLYDAFSGSNFFNGANLGTFTSSSQILSISFWDIKTYKNNTSDVQQAKLYYRIYEQGQSAGTFTEFIGGWLQDLGGGNQKWGKDQPSSIDITNLLASKTYVVEVYIQVYGTVPDQWKFDNNGGSNYKATFTTTSSFPVELVNFNAFIHLQKVNLNWQTATEINNYGFEVEKRQTSNVKSETWTSIGFVNGHGNSNSPKHYSFTDKDVASGNYSYRLKQIDNDGKYEYSKEVEVVINTAPSEFELSQNFPNPFNPNTNIKYSLPNKEFVSLKVFNVLGNEVASLVNEVQEAGSYKVEFNSASIKNQSSGIYFYRLEAGSFVESRKMTLIK